MRRDTEQKIQNVSTTIGRKAGERFAAVDGMVLAERMRHLFDEAEQLNETTEQLRDRIRAEVKK